MRSRRRIIAIFLAALGIAVAAPAVTPTAVVPLLASIPIASAVAPDNAEAYLHVAAAYDRAKTHVSNYDCPSFNGCYAYPAALNYDRRSDTRVLVLIRMYSNSRGACDSWFDIRGSDTNSTLEHYGLWVC